MNNTYNSNMYLTTNSLNDIENNVENITNEIQEKIFDNQLSPLQNIEIGDYLNSKILYLSFPRNSYQNITSTTQETIITTDNNNTIGCVYNNDKKTIYVSYKNNLYPIYNKNDVDFNPDVNKIRLKLPYDFGIVTNVDTNNYFYQFIQIYDNDMIIPNYEKHVWSDNEILSMQKIDNIENAINNIGKYYYRPVNWLNTREWLKNSDIFDDNYNTNIQNISYQDLNRWLNNLSLISFDDLDKMTIWNTNFTQIEWNGESNVEWEEY
jgi:hypothetical protein